MESSAPRRCDAILWSIWMAILDDEDAVKVIADFDKRMQQKFPSYIPGTLQDVCTAYRTVVYSNQTYRVFIIHGKICRYSTEIASALQIIPPRKRKRTSSPPLISTQPQPQPQPQPLLSPRLRLPLPYAVPVRVLLLWGWRQDEDGWLEAPSERHVNGVFHQQLQQLQQQYDKRWDELHVQLERDLEELQGTAAYERRSHEHCLKCTRECDEMYEKLQSRQARLQVTNDNMLGLVRVLGRQ